MQKVMALWMDMVDWIICKRNDAVKVSIGHGDIISYYKTIPLIIKLILSLSVLINQSMYTHSHSFYFQHMVNATHNIMDAL